MSPIIFFKIFVSINLLALKINLFNPKKIGLNFHQEFEDSVFLDYISNLDNFVLCWLATSSKDGQPNVSPKEVFLFKDIEECVKSIQELLSMHKDKRTAIRNAAKNKSVLHYTYKKQVELLTVQINTL